MVTDHERTADIDTVFHHGIDTHPDLRFPASAVIIRRVGTIEYIVDTPASCLYARAHLAMDGLEGVDIEVTATQTGLVCYDYGLETGIVQAFYGLGDIIEDLELVGIVAIWNILGQGIVAIEENRLVTEHLPLDDTTDYMVRAEVGLLYARGLLGWDDDRTIHDILEDTAVSGERNGLRTPLLGSLDGQDDILGIARGGHTHNDIPLPAVGLDLSLEHDIIGVVIAYGGDGSYVGETYARKCGTLEHVPAGELGCDVLGIGR